jgi:hypothetical protein
VSAASTRDRADPGEHTAIDAQLDYLRAYADKLAADLQRYRDHGDRQLAAAEARSREQLDSARDSIGDTRAKLATLRAGMIGPAGRGIGWAVVGLALTALGVALTIAGLPW